MVYLRCISVYFFMLLLGLVLSVNVDITNHCALDEEGVLCTFNDDVVLKKDTKFVNMPKMVLLNQVAITCQDNDEFCDIEFEENTSTITITQGAHIKGKRIIVRADTLMMDHDGGSSPSLDASATSDEVDGQHKGDDCKGNGAAHAGDGGYEVNDDQPRKAYGDFTSLGSHNCELIGQSVLGGGHITIDVNELQGNGLVSVKGADSEDYSGASGGSIKLLVQERSDDTVFDLRGGNSASFGGGSAGRFLTNQRMQEDDLDTETFLGEGGNSGAGYKTGASAVISSQGTILIRKSEDEDVAASLLSVVSDANGYRVFGKAYSVGTLKPVYLNIYPFGVLNTDGTLDCTTDDTVIVNGKWVVQKKFTCEVNILRGDGEIEATDASSKLFYTARKEGTVDANSNFDIEPNCNPGSYLQKDGNDAICDFCNEGEYSEGGPVAECQKCKIGSWSIAGSGKCEDCAPGKYGTSTGCFSCEPGTFSSKKGSTICETCPKNYVSKAKSTKCNDECPSDRIWYVKPKADDFPFRMAACKPCDFPKVPDKSQLKCVDFFVDDEPSKNRRWVWYLGSVVLVVLILLICLVGVLCGVCLLRNRKNAHHYSNLIDDVPDDEEPRTVQTRYPQQPRPQYPQQQGHPQQQGPRPQYPQQQGQPRQQYPQQPGQPYPQQPGYPLPPGQPNYPQKPTYPPSLQGNAPPLVNPKQTFDDTIPEDDDIPEYSQVTTSQPSFPGPQDFSDEDNQTYGL